MSTGRSEAHPPQKVKHDRRSNGRIILFMSASFALGIESHCAVRRKACRNRRTAWITRRHPALKCDSGAIVSLPCGEQKRRIRPSEGLGNYRRQSEQSRMELGLCLSDLIPTGERAGLQTHIAAESGSLCVRMKN